MGSFISFEYNHEEARTQLYLAYLAAAPFILRSAGEWMINMILEKCCKMDKKEARISLIGKGDSSVTIDNIWFARKSWADAQSELELNKCAAVTLSVIRLLFWHWLQPFLYFFVLYAYWDLLGQIQQILGLVVCGREILYFLMTVFAAGNCPVYLLVDLKASWKSMDDWWERVMAVGCYVLAPEKYVAAAILKMDAKTEFSECFVFVFLPLLDLGGFAAFVAAIVLDNMHIPLMIGYAITSLGGVFVVILVIIGFCIGRL